MSKWYETLEENAREDLWAWMRSAGVGVQACLERSRELEAPFGSIAVGAGSFDHFIGGEAVEEILRGLRQGDDPDEALERAKRHARLCVRKHNARRPDYTWQRHEETAYPVIEALHRSLKEQMRRAQA